MKKAILTGMILALMSLVLSSCAAGVSTEEYAKVSSDLAVAQEQIEILQGELSAKQSELETATEKLDQVRTRMIVLKSLYALSLYDYEAHAVYDPLTLIIGWRSQVLDVGDPILTEKFDIIFVQTDDEKMAEKIFEFKFYLLESTWDILYPN